MAASARRSSSANKLVDAPKFLDSRSTFREVKKIVENASIEILLVSPFINKKLLEVLLQSVSANVTVTLVTRFRILDLLGNFNDLSIFDFFRQQENMHLRLLHSLHAKYYRGDSNVILGSGNLTYKGLPPNGSGNTEVMLKLDSSTQGLREFEENLISQSIEPTDQMVNELRDQLNKLKETQQFDSLLIETARENQIFKPAFWVPLCEMPNSLYEVYGNRVSEIDIEIVNQARSDLSFLALPNGLDQDGFNSNVRIALQQTKVISLMLADLRLNHRIDVSTCRAIVAKAFNGDSPADIDEIWKRYRQWLIVFFDGFTR